MSWLSCEAFSDQYQTQHLIHLTITHLAQEVVNPVSTEPEGIREGQYQHCAMLLRVLIRYLIEDFIDLQIGAYYICHLDQTNM